VLVAARRIHEATGFRLTAEERHRSFGKDLVGQTWELNLRADSRARKLHEPVTTEPYFLGHQSCAPMTLRGQEWSVPVQTQHSRKQSLPCTIPTRGDNELLIWIYLTKVR
jgi:hypothetical protein